MEIEDIIIQCSDGVSLSGTLFTPQNTPSGSVVIAAALGVPRQFYRAFATYLANNGFAAVTFDYRGIGDSLDADGKLDQITMEVWGRLDIDAVLEEIYKRFEPKPVFLVGHSCGGQIFGLAQHSEKLSGVIFISAQIANWRLWPPPSNISMLIFWHALVPMICLGRNTFPARTLGLSSVDAPSGVVAQWARWARQREYLFSSQFGLDVHRYTEFSFPVLAYAFDDDTYAPWKAVKALLAKLPNAKIEIDRVQVSRLGVGKIGHFGFFKEKMNETLWPRTTAWIRKISGEEPIIKK